MYAEIYCDDVPFVSFIAVMEFLAMVTRSKIPRYFCGKDAYLAEFRH